MYEEILDQMQELLKDEIENFGDDFGKLNLLLFILSEDLSTTIPSKAKANLRQRRQNQANSQFHHNSGQP